MYTYKSHYQNYLENLQPNDRYVDVDTYTDTYIEYLVGEEKIPFDDSEIILIRCERLWHKNNTLYFNVKPNIIEAIDRFRLNNISLELLNLKESIANFTINIPSFEGFEKGVSALVSKTGSNALSFSIQMSEGNLIFNLRQVSQNLSVEEYIEAAFDIQKRGDFRYYKLGGSRDKNKEEENKQKAISKSPSYQELVKFLVRTFCCCKFLYDCPNEELLSVDLSERFIDKWSGASEGAKRDYVIKSRNAGKGGYNLGVNYKLIENADRLSEQSSGERQGELKYNHIRTGHLHAVRYGEGKKNVKLMWFRPTVVRPDLPSKPLD